MLSLDPASTVNARPGQPERWRLIHGGIRDTIKVAIYKAKSAIPKGAEFLSAKQRSEWMFQNCDPSRVIGAI